MGHKKKQFIYRLMNGVVGPKELYAIPIYNKKTNFDLSFTLAIPPLHPVDWVLNDGARVFLEQLLA